MEPGVDHAFEEGFPRTNSIHTEKRRGNGEEGGEVKDISTLFTSQLIDTSSTTSDVLTDRHTTPTATAQRSWQVFRQQEHRQTTPQLPGVAPSC